MPLGGRKTGHPVRLDESRHFRPVNLFVEDRQGGNHLVIPPGNITAARRLCGLWIVQLGSVLIHVPEAQAQSGQRSGDQFLKDGLLGRTSPDTVQPYRVQPQHRTEAVVRAHQYCYRSQHILYDGVVAAQMALELHP